MSVLRRSKEDKLWMCYIKACKSSVTLLKGKLPFKLEFIDIHPFKTFDWSISDLELGYESSV